MANNSTRRSSCRRHGRRRLPSGALSRGVATVCRQPDDRGVAGNPRHKPTVKIMFIIVVSSRPCTSSISSSCPVRLRPRQEVGRRSCWMLLQRWAASSGNGGTSSPNAPLSSSCDLPGLLGVIAKWILRPPGRVDTRRNVSLRLAKRSSTCREPARDRERTCSG